MHLLCNISCIYLVLFTCVFKDNVMNYSYLKKKFKITSTHFLQVCLRYFKSRFSLKCFHRSFNLDIINTAKKELPRIPTVKYSLLIMIKDNAYLMLY